MSVTEHPPRRWRPTGERRLVRGRAASAVSEALARRSPWWIELLAIAWLVVIYDRVTALAPLRLHAAIAHGQGILALERTLHLDPELSLNRWLVGHHTLGIVVSYYYDNAHFIVTLGVLAWLWWRRPDLYPPLRNSLVLINVIGFVVFWRYPVAPPRLLPGNGFVDIVARSHTFGSWHTGSLAADADQLAAMPSLHLAWAAWSGLAIWRLSRRWWGRALAVLYPFVTAVAVMTTGNHYLIDVLAGIATMVVSVALVEIALPRSRASLGRRRASRRAVPAE